MSAAFHTFKLVPTGMAPNNRTTTPILPPSTPLNGSQSLPQNVNRETPTTTPSSDSRMNPPSLPRSLMTPAREMRESSVVSTAGNSGRKPRVNVDTDDHLAMLKHCYEQREYFKEGMKSEFWKKVNAGFQADTGKILAQMSATVGRLVEARRRQISDWEAGVIPQKPGGELNEALDQWMEFLKTEDADAEAERMRQVDARRKIEEARKEARRQALAAEAVNAQNHPEVRMVSAPQQAAVNQLPAPLSHEQGAEMIQSIGEAEINGYRPNKRRRRDERQPADDIEAQHAAWHAQQAQHYVMQHPSQPHPEAPKRVIVEGALTKDDWRDIMGNDARLRTLESKVDKIEVIVSQNNKLLLQLVQNQSRDHDRDRDRNEEDRVPVHLDAEFERDYLSGRYSKTPLPIP